MWVGFTILNSWASLAAEKSCERSRAKGFLPDGSRVSAYLFDIVSFIIVAARRRGALGVFDESNEVIEKVSLLARLRVNRPFEIMVSKSIYFDCGLRERLSSSFLP